MTVRYSDLQKRGAPATTDRRDALLDWLRQHYQARGYGLSAREIAEDSRLYDGLNGRQEGARPTCEHLSASAWS